MEDRKVMTAIMTDASSGIGNAIAQRLAKDGYVFFGTSRTPTAVRSELFRVDRHLFDGTTQEEACDA